MRERGHFGSNEEEKKITKKCDVMLYRGTFDGETIYDT
jgi:hypothetical protein